MLDKPRISLFFPPHLIHSIIHEHSCKVQYLLNIVFIEHGISSKFSLFGKEPISGCSSIPRVWYKYIAFYTIFHTKVHINEYITKQR